MVVAGLWFFVGLKDDKIEVIPVAKMPTEAKKSETPEVLGYISSDRVGIFKIGAPVLLANEGYSVKETTYFPEGHAQKIYAVSKNGKEVLNYVLTSLNAVSNIYVKSSSFITEKDIAIGSTISDFIKAYPNYSLWYTAEEGEKFILNTTKDAPTLQFFLLREDLVDSGKTYLDFKKGIKVSDFKTDAKITDIRVYWLP